jgi:hypothetical protein
MASSEFTFGSSDGLEARLSDQIVAMRESITDALSNGDTSHPLLKQTDITKLGFYKAMQDSLGDPTHPNLTHIVELTKLALESRQHDTTSFCAVLDPSNNELVTLDVSDIAQAIKRANVDVEHLGLSMKQDSDSEMLNQFEQAVRGDVEDELDCLARDIESDALLDQLDADRHHTDTAMQELREVRDYTSELQAVMTSSAQDSDAGGAQHSDAGGAHHSDAPVGTDDQGVYTEVTESVNKWLSQIQAVPHKLDCPSTHRELYRSLCQGHAACTTHIRSTQLSAANIKRTEPTHVSYTKAQEALRQYGLSITQMRDHSHKAPSTPPQVLSSLPPGARVLPQHPDYVDTVTMTTWIPGVYRDLVTTLDTRHLFMFDDLVETVDLFKLLVQYADISAFTVGPGQDGFAYTTAYTPREFDTPTLPRPEGLYTDNTNLYSLNMARTSLRHGSIDPLSAGFYVQDDASCVMSGDPTGRTDGFTIDFTDSEKKPPNQKNVLNAHILFKQARLELSLVEVLVKSTIDTKVPKSLKEKARWYRDLYSLHAPALSLILDVMRVMKDPELIHNALKNLDTFDLNRGISLHPEARVYAMATYLLDAAWIDMTKPSENFMIHGSRATETLRDIKETHYAQGTRHQDIDAYCTNPLDNAKRWAAAAYDSASNDKDRGRLTFVAEQTRVCLQTYAIYELVIDDPAKYKLLFPKGGFVEDYIRQGPKLGFGHFEARQYLREHGCALKECEPKDYKYELTRIFVPVRKTMTMGKDKRWTDAFCQVMPLFVRAPDTRSLPLVPGDEKVALSDAYCRALLEVTSLSVIDGCATLDKISQTSQTTPHSLHMFDLCKTIDVNTPQITGSHLLFNHLSKVTNYGVARKKEVRTAVNAFVKERMGIGIMKKHNANKAEEDPWPRKSTYRPVRKTMCMFPYEGLDLPQGMSILQITGAVRTLTRQSVRAEKKEKAAKAAELKAAKAQAAEEAEANATQEAKLKAAKDKDRAANAAKDKAQAAKGKAQAANAAELKAAKDKAQAANAAELKAAKVKAAKDKAQAAKDKAQAAEEADANATQEADQKEAELGAVAEENGTGASEKKESKSTKKIRTNSFRGGSGLDDEDFWKKAKEVEKSAPDQKEAEENGTDTAKLPNRRQARALKKAEELKRAAAAGPNEAEPGAAAEENGTNTAKDTPKELNDKPTKAQKRAQKKAAAGGSAAEENGSAAANP